MVLNKFGIDPIFNFFFYFIYLILNFFFFFFFFWMNYLSLNISKVGVRSFLDLLFIYLILIFFFFNFFLDELSEFENGQSFRGKSRDKN